VSTEVKRNYLEIKNLEDLLEGQKPLNDCTVKIIEPINFKINKFFYKQIGKKHRWIDRLTWEDKKWIEYVENPRIKTFILKDNNSLAGYYETIHDFDNNHSEIAYFGILEEYFGKKCGGYLLSEAIKKLFEEGMTRVWLHTCSLDHENAIKNYLARGMQVFKSEKINVDLN
jgi:ribosomal protein S18 acetylase RimI-like enzyme